MVVLWVQEGLVPPATLFQPLCESSAAPRKKGREMVTWCCVSSVPRLTSPMGEPMTKVPGGIQFMPGGAQRSFAVPAGAVAQKLEKHCGLVVQAPPKSTLGRHSVPDW